MNRFQINNKAKKTVHFIEINNIIGTIYIKIFSINIV